MLGKPRTQHVTFTGLALREAAFADPRAVVSALHDAVGAQKLLSGLWEIVAAHCRDVGEPDDMASDGLSVYTAAVAGYPTAIVAMPPPQAPGEVWFAALVLRLRMLDDGPVLLSPPLFYVTLEREVSEDATALVEWTDDAVRHSYGAGPRPGQGAAENFVQAVEDLVEKLVARGES